MEAMRESWTDERLDDLNEKVDRHFEEVRRRFDGVERRLDLADERFARLGDGLVRVNDRLDSIQRSMAHLAVGLTAGMLAGFGGMATLLATQI
jgi:tetrahydromethanopterin S-methyltransferase subunit G